MLHRLVIGAILAVVGALALPTAASTAELSLSVQPLMSELHVGPGAGGSVNVRVTNGGNVTARITIEPVDWTTTLDGDVRFGTVGTQGAKSISKYLAMTLVPFLLAPGETRQVPLTLKLPASFSNEAAAYWGGFLVRSAQADHAGVGPAATVFVYETVGEPRTHLRLTSLRVTPAGAAGAIVSARLNNDAAAYARLSGRLVITSSAGRVVHDEDISTTTIFPNQSRVISRDLKGLAAGIYQAELSVDYGGDVLLSGTTSFAIH